MQQDSSRLSGPESLSEYSTKLNPKGERSHGLKISTVNPQWVFPPSVEVELQDTRSEVENQGLLPPTQCSFPLDCLPPYLLHYISPLPFPSLSPLPPHFQEWGSALSITITVRLHSFIPLPNCSHLPQCHWSFRTIPRPKQMDLTQGAYSLWDRTVLCHQIIELFKSFENYPDYSVMWDTAAVL